MKMNWIPIALAGGIVAALFLSRKKPEETAPRGALPPEGPRPTAPGLPPPEQVPRPPTGPVPPPEQVPRPPGGLGQIPPPSSPTQTIPPVRPPLGGVVARPGGANVLFAYHDPVLVATINELKALWVGRPEIQDIVDVYSPAKGILVYAYRASADNVRAAMPSNFRGYPVTVAPVEMTSTPGTTNLPRT